MVHSIQSMQMWSEASASDLQNVQGVCLDIDDTLSTDGKLTDRAFSSLWRLKNAGFRVVPITGRPAGWCDHIVRFWPVDAVVGENGAFSFYMETSNSTNHRKRIDTLSGEAETGASWTKKKLLTLAEKIKTNFPQAEWASDQNYREFDLAVDICEDVPAWRAEEVDRLLEFCHQEGAKAKLSSIHVNTWFGDFDKLKGFEFLLKHLNKENPKAWPIEGSVFSQWLFIGDSPNDEPLFSKFPISVGVANLRRYADRLKHPPRWVTLGKSGEGFSEMVDRLIELRDLGLLKTR